MVIIDQLQTFYINMHLGINVTFSPHFSSYCCTVIISLKFCIYCVAPLHYPAALLHPAPLPPLLPCPPPCTCHSTLCCLYCPTLHPASPLPPCPTPLHFAATALCPTLCYPCCPQLNFSVFFFLMLTRYAQPGPS